MIYMVCYNSLARLLRSKFWAKKDSAHSLTFYQYFVLLERWSVDGAYDNDDNDSNNNNNNNNDDNDNRGQ